MAGNIKLEIIYYETEPDATLEFGLQGGFAVRILSNQVDNYSDLVAALKKASLRNEFIVIVGGFEKSGVAEVVAKAIGREAAVIHEDSTIALPSDSIPLLSSEGELCGAVVESGYQSIILLSEEKEHRDSVLLPLLLPYLTERYGEIHGVQPNAEEITVQEAEASTEENEAEPSGEEELEVDYEPDSEVPEDSEEQEVPEGFFDDMQDFMIEDLPVTMDAEESEEPKPKKKKRVWLILLIVFLSLALIFGSAFSYLFYFVPWQTNNKTVEFSNLYAEDKTFVSLGNVNSDIAGWLKMRDAGIDTPVVNGKGKEVYYSYHLLDGTLNPVGTPYLTEKPEMFNGLYVMRMNGHYSQLSKYLNKDFADKNRFFAFDSTSYTARWKIFSAFSFGKEPAFDYLKSSFTNTAEYEKQLRILKNASEIGVDELDKEDSVVVFSATRFGETVVVAARLIEQTESNSSVPVITEPDETSSITSSEADSSSQTSSETISKAPEIYSADNNDTKLDDTVDTWQDLPPLTEEQVKDNLKPQTKPPVTSTVTSSATSSAIPNGPIVTIANNNVNVRSGAGTSYSKIGQVDKGEVFKYLGVQQDSNKVNWYKIQYTSSKVGYVSSQFSKTSGVPTSSSAASSTISSSRPSSVVSSSVSSSTVSNSTLLVKVLGNKVNVRSGAGTNYKSLGQANLWETFPYVSEKTASGVVWYCIQYTDSAVGWISSGFAEKINPNEDNNNTDEIVLTFSNNGKVMQGSVLDVVASVIEAEMGSGYELEALKAQAVATYSFMLTRGAHKGTAVEVPMKAPGAKALQAAKAVLGQCAYYNGSVAQTYYYAISAGYTANCKDIWTASLGYLVAVESTPDSSAKGFATTVTLTSAQVKEKLNKKYSKSYPNGLPFDSVPKDKWLVCTYDENNAYCKTVLIANKLQTKGNSIYSTLGLRSPAYTVTYNADNDTFVFNVRGYGHGVGLSQVGANGYAKQGWDYKKILQHYYKGVVIK